MTVSICSNSLITHGIINPGGGRVAGIYPSYANANTQSVIYNGWLPEPHKCRINRNTQVPKIIVKKLRKKEQRKTKIIEQLVQLSTLRAGNFLNMFLHRVQVSSLFPQLAL